MDVVFFALFIVKVVRSHDPQVKGVALAKVIALVWLVRAYAFAVVSYAHASIQSGWAT